MNWETIPGHKALIKQLKENINTGKVAHAQLFCGYDGSAALPLAMAYADELLSKNSSAQSLNILNHPDVYFSYPVFLNKDKHIEKSTDVLAQWRAFIEENPFGDLNQWRNYFSDAGNKQFVISVEESSQIMSNFSLKSHQGGYKIQLIWMPEKMNRECTNKLLKLIEEPPKDSLLLLISSKPQALLPTLISRCQRVDIPLLESAAIEEYLVTKMGISNDKASRIANQAGGSIGKALVQAKSNSENQFEDFFVEWIRNSFLAKTNLKALQQLEDWSKRMNGLGRDVLLEFIGFSLEIFRLALHENYGNQTLTYTGISKEGFNWKAFCNYIHGENIEEIYTLLNKASYEIARNVSCKSVLLNLSIDITREIHKKVG